MMHWTSFIPSTDFSPLIESVFRGLLLAVLVAGGLTLLRVRNVIAQKTAWILVLAAAFAMPALAPLGMRIPVPDADAFNFYLHRTQRIVGTTRTIPLTPTVTEFRTDEQAGPLTDADDSQLTLAQPRSGNDNFSGPATPTTVIPAPRPAAPLLTRLQFLFLLYCGVCLTMLFRIVRGVVLAHRLWRTAEPVDNALVAQLAGSIAVRSSARITSPLNVGSSILLPADFAQWDEEKLSVVLAHEASHVRQRDFYLQLAAQLYAAIFWFSPLGWWMGRKLSDLSEAISDHAGLGSAPNPAAYAQILLEFAALARPTTTGVAMARPGRLTQRIERLLNESSFRQAFTASRVRIGAAVLLVPACLFAATAMVRVHAAQLQQTPVVAPPPATVPPQQQPAPGNSEPLPKAPATPQVTPPVTPEQPGEPTPPEQTGPLTVQIPPIPPIKLDAQDLADAQALAGKIQTNLALNAQARALVNARVQAQIAKAMAQNGRFGYWLGNNRDPYAIVRRSDENGTVHLPKTRTWGSWYNGAVDEYQAEIEKAKGVAHGDFIWFRRDGKSYVIDDPAILAELKPMQDKMEALGKQQQDLGKQQEALGKQQEELGRQMEQVKVPTPDMKKELAKLQAVQAKLAALQGKDASQEQLSQIRAELADVQGRIGAIQGDMGGRMGDLGGKMGALGGQQGKLGAEQGRLGAEQGRLAREMDGKILTTIDESLKNGKARPVN